MAGRRLVVMRARDFSTRPEPRKGGLGLVLAGALLLGLAAQQTLAARSALEEARSQVSAERRVVAGLRESLTRRDAGSGDGVPSRALAVSTSPPSRVLGDLVALLPAGVRLDSLGLSYGRRVEMDLQVVARGARDYDAFLERLARSPRFEAVQPGPERREGEVRVAVHATYRPEAER